MSFWTSSKLKAELRKESLITPFDLTRVQHGAYELALGGEYYDTSLKMGRGQKPLAARSRSHLGNSPF